MFTQTCSLLRGEFWSLLALILVIQSAVHDSSVSLSFIDNVQKDVLKILERGEAVLHSARRGELEVLESLLEKGATTDFCDQYGLTALHVAAIKGIKDVVMMLVEFGADVERTDAEGHTALHMAVEGGSVETVEVLINRGANMSAKTKKGATPLYISKLMEYEDITQLLIDKGAAL
ncbi:UNVERIFIED_CONTAM: hypothetical protein Sradi_6591400 [Sesamum radiatum]|uniref:Ankyrin repeat protein n=1 Tax=Sesamum radiatum TaxID=300843 RepID=A0AAW2JY99_SESRA